MSPRTLSVLVLVTTLAACAPGACQRSITVEICGNTAPEGACRPPTGGYAAGLQYGLRASGPTMPREVEIALLELDEAGAPNEITRVGAEVPEGADRLDRRVIFPVRGRYRVEIRRADGSVLGRRDVDVTVETVRPATR